MPDKSAYAVLNTRKGADENEIKRAYVEMVKKFDPEKHTERFMVIQNAYERLRDPKKRASEDVFAFNYIRGEFSFAQEERTEASDLELLQKQKALEKALEENPRNRELIDQMTQVKMCQSWYNFNRKFYKKAIMDWQTILDLDATHRRAKNNLNFACIYLGYHYAEHDLCDEALECWERALQINPDNLPLIHNISIAAELGGQQKKATKHWNETLKRWKLLLDKDPNNEYVKQCIIEVRKRHGSQAMDEEKDGSSAIREYEEVLKIRPDDFHAQYQIALAQIEAGDYATAAGTLLSMKVKHPRNTEVLNMLGMAQLNKGAVNDAFNTWKNSLKIDPKNYATRDHIIKAHIGVGKKFRESGQFTQALVHFKQLERYLPNSEEVFFEVANTYLLKGDKRSAQTQFKRVLDINPNNKMAKKAMSELRLGR